MNNGMIFFGDDARKKLIFGSELLYNSVKVTLGAKGRNVIIRKSKGQVPLITKDGVTVAEFVEHPDPVVQMGVETIRQTATSTAYIAGDGTTTSVVLAHAMASSMMKRPWYYHFIKPLASVNTVEIKEGIDAAVRLVCDYIDEQKIDITDNYALLKQVAIISANGDKEIGELVADIVYKTGELGTIDIRPSKNAATSSFVAKGVKIDAGMIHPIFVTNGKDNVCELENPFVLIAYDPLETRDHIMEILTHCVKNERPLLVVGKSITKEAYNMLVMNHTKGAVKCGVIVLPEISAIGELLLNDLCIATGATLYRRQQGIVKVTPSLLGGASRAVVKQNESFIVDGIGDESLVQERITELISQLSVAKNSFEKMVLQSRLSRISGKTGVIEVGGSTEAEMYERKDRIDDAVHAAKAALLDGVVAGGGVCLASAHKCLEDLKLSNNSLSFYKGIKIVESALTAPRDIILANAGLSNKGLKNDGIHGIDVTKGTEVNMIEAGIVDPSKVTKTALTSAASVAGVLLTTECAIVYQHDRENRDRD